jgi:hypothetical protein
MKTLADGASQGAAAIVHLASVADESLADPVQRARAFAEPLLAGQTLDTGEDALGHADGVAPLLRQIGASPTLCAAAYLVYAGDYLQRPEEMVRKAFGESYASLVTLTRKLVQIQRAARAAQVGAGQRAEQTERVRKMLLAFSRDLRVVLLRLASRLQTLRWFAAHKRACPQDLADESLQVFAPLANRLGIWQIKWEIEDYCVPLPAPRRVPAHGAPGGRDAQRRAKPAWPARAQLAAAAGRCRPARRRAGPAQAPVQHLEEDAGQGAGLSRMSSTRGRCAWWWTTSRPAMPRWPGCTKPGARWKASSTTTSPGPNPTATRACTPWCWATTAGRWKCRSAPAPCTSTPNTAWPRTGCTRKPARAGMPASVRSANSKSAWPKRARPCCVNCWPGSATFAEQGGSAGARGVFDDRIYVFTPQAT